MIKTRKVSLIFGTRPEAIKLAPVIAEMRSREKLDLSICVTAQHRQMLDQVLEVFNIDVDEDLNVMVPEQTLASLTSKLMIELDGYLARTKPDIVVVQGDTTTAMCGALASFYRKISIAHVEAGLRTGNIFSPWPEEANRLIVSRFAKWHFAPTETNRKNLLSEGVGDEQIFVTGNTVIDSLFKVAEAVRKCPPNISGLPGNSLSFLGNARMVLITGHRRENFGTGFECICHAISDLANIYPEIHFIYPVHLNPNVRTPVENILGCGSSGKKRLKNVHLIEPQNYLQFVALMDRSSIILTDSGGVQEEAPSLNKPVLVMRDTTERQEAVESGAVALVGTNRCVIVDKVTCLLDDAIMYSAMIHKKNPFGDGHAAERIVGVLDVR